MVEINLMKIIAMIKKLIESALFVAFLYMTVKALNDVFSNRTTLIVTEEHRNITFLPAFSVCEDYVMKIMGSDKKDLVNGSMVLKSLAVRFNFKVSFTYEGKGGSSITNFNLMDDIEIQNNLQNVNLVDLWTLQCKPFAKGNSNCMPCITFNGANLETQGIIENVVVNSLKIDSISVKINY